MSDIIEKHLLISGRVQGVGFRYFTKKNAARTGVTGMVKNLQTGDVEVVIRGTEEQVMQMEAALSNGPPGAQIDDIKELEPTGENFEDFSIRRF